MDIGTGLALLGSKEIIVKILGPTAEYLGTGIKQFGEKRVESLKRIFKDCSKKLGDRLNDSGGVPPRVLMGTIEYGSYADNPITVGYFGGVLASSRSGISRDDRGAYFNSLISRLSTYQLRAHYLLYHAIKNAYHGMEGDFSVGSDRRRSQLYMPYATFIKAMDLWEEETIQAENLYQHIFNGLLKEDLLDSMSLGAEFANKPDGFVVQVSALGVELFLWANGCGTEKIGTFLSKEKVYELDDSITLPPEYLTYEQFQNTSKMAGG